MLLPPGRYCIGSPTLALFEEDGRYIVHTVPTGAIIALNGEPLDDGRLIEVFWEGKTVIVFTEDLHLRATTIDG